MLNTSTADAPEQKLRRHVFCVVNSHPAGDEAAAALHQLGISETGIEVLFEEPGLERLQERMEGSLWGESAEDAYQDGISALHDGKSVLFVEAPTLDAARKIAAVLKPFGAREVFHFGDLVDTRLTP